MTNDSTYKPLRRYLAQLHTYAQNIEVTFRKAVEDTAQVGREAEAAEIDFKAFTEEWTAMLLVAQDLADENGKLAVFAESWADLLLTIRAKIAANEELRVMLETSLANKIGNAELIGQNIGWLAEVTPEWIANYISLVRSEGIMRDAIEIADGRGEPATLRLKWMANKLKELGY